MEWYELQRKRQWIGDRYKKRDGNYDKNNKEWKRKEGAVDKKRREVGERRKEMTCEGNAWKFKTAKVKINSINGKEVNKKMGNHEQKTGVPKQKKWRGRKKWDIKKIYSNLRKKTNMEKLIRHKQNEAKQKNKKP